jgi:hypothetical protein
MTGLSSIAAKGLAGIGSRASPRRQWPARMSASASTVSVTASGPSWKVVISVMVCTPAFSMTMPRSTSARATS